MAIAAPTDIANCVLWLDASQEAYADGAAVTTWTDRSGAGNSATQGTAGATPTFRTNIQNSLPALQFDGTADHMDLPAAVFDIYNGTSFAVAQTTTLNPVGGRPARYILGFRTSLSKRWYIATNVNADVFEGATGDTISTLGPADTDWHVHWLRSTANRKAGRVSCVGPVVEWTDGDTGTNETSGGIGSLIGTQEWWQGYIAEIVHYSRGLTDTETMDVYRYLTAKYGLPNCLIGPTVGYIGPGLML